jgi:hypothetical protein
VITEARRKASNAQSSIFSFPADGAKDRGETALYRLLHGLPARADHSRNPTARTEE